MAERVADNDEVSGSNPDGPSSGGLRARRRREREKPCGRGAKIPGGPQAGGAEEATAEGARRRRRLEGRQGWRLEGRRIAGAMGPAGFEPATKRL